MGLLIEQKEGQRLLISIKKNWSLIITHKKKHTHTPIQTHTTTMMYIFLNIKNCNSLLLKPWPCLTIYWSKGSKDPCSLHKRVYFRENVFRDCLKHATCAEWVSELSLTHISISAQLALTVFELYEGAEWSKFVHEQKIGKLFPTLCRSCIRLK